ncbi:MAG: GNAT family N-acetyltransferase [Actinomycetota bacterium]
MLQPIDVFDFEVASRVIAIQRESYRVEADLIGFDGIPPLHETADVLANLDPQWLGSWEDGLLVGIMAWSVQDGHCEIDRLAVHPGFFRRGHGRTLVSSLLHHRLVTVSTGTMNIPARRLYESLGFVPMNEREIAPGVTSTGFRRSR